MKKIFSILLTLIAALGVFSCQIEKDADGSQYLAGPALEIVSKEVVFAPQGGSGSIVINTRETLSASADRSWATVTVAGNRVTVTVDRNESLESRYATIKLAAGGATAEVQAQQFGINSAHAWDDTYTFPFGGGELDLPYGENGTVWVDVSETNWISALVDEENHLIHFTVAKSIYNYERVGHVTVTIGDDYTRELTFIQQKNPAGLNPGEEEPVEFTVQPAWTPKYIQPTDPKDPMSTVGVDVAEGQSGGRYFIQVVPQADFNAAGADEQIFLNRNAATWAAASPRLFRATSTLEIDKLENGSYRVYAIGVNNDNEVNHTYAVATFNVTKVLSPYEKFLGTWSIQRGTFDDVWTIVEKEPGKSYTITGLEGGSQAFLGEYEITAEFDSSDNSFSIKTHPNLGQYTFTNSGESHTVTMRLTGLVTYNGKNDFQKPYPCYLAYCGDFDITQNISQNLSSCRRRSGSNRLNDCLRLARPPEIPRPLWSCIRIPKIHARHSAFWQGQSQCVVTVTNECHKSRCQDISCTESPSIPACTGLKCFSVPQNPQQWSVFLRKRPKTYLRNICPSGDSLFPLSCPQSACCCIPVYTFHQ